ncbi:gas vesicle protein GvpG [Streptomyces capitiformicae]|uniref:Gas vesicle protein n=1 Tax=Streptomyces capitiformicae TaxID=2014920 RepID=A0A919L9V7_9ACTN|nr:gas vesicle protein GvpG [Streptomyces capitiformicae]GHH88449.1 gas vesicle protein [Streptomyces capitiformicae]
MGLVGTILTFPLAPVRGVGWVVDKVRQAAEDKYYDPAPVQEELVNLETARTEGRIDEADFARREEELLHRLQEISAYRLQQGG